MPTWIILREKNIAYFRHRECISWNPIILNNLRTWSKSWSDTFFLLSCSINKSLIVIPDKLIRVDCKRIEMALPKDIVVLKWEFHGDVFTHVAVPSLNRKESRRATKTRVSVIKTLLTSWKAIFHFDITSVVHEISLSVGFIRSQYCCSHIIIFITISEVQNSILKSCCSWSWPMVIPLGMRMSISAILSIDILLNRSRRPWPIEHFSCWKSRSNKLTGHSIINKNDRSNIHMVLVKIRNVSCSVRTAGNIPSIEVLLEKRVKQHI